GCQIGKRASAPIGSEHCAFQQNNHGEDCSPTKSAQHACDRQGEDARLRIPGHVNTDSGAM
ncbi:MAG: hypothetical protein WBW60_05825, partial [Candidatus Sulfotelmatobacter sp.]